MGPCDFLAEVVKPSVVLAIENTQNLSRCLRARQVQKEIIALCAQKPGGNTGGAFCMMICLVHLPGS